MYRTKLPGATVLPTARDADLFVRAIRALQESVDTGRPMLRDEASRLLAQIGYRITLVEEKYLYISEEEKGARGWGIYVIDTQSKAGLLIGVPAPLTEQGTLEAGAALFNTQKAHSLAIAGAEKSGALESSTAATRGSASLFQLFCREVSRNNSLQVRGYTIESVREISGLRPEKGSVSPPLIETSLWVRGTLPPGLDLKLLRESVSALKIEWRAPPFENTQRMLARNGFAELLVNYVDMRTITFKQLLSAYATTEAMQQVRIDGYLQDWLFARKNAIAERGSNSYLKPRLEELLLFDAEVVTPLARLARADEKNGLAKDRDSALRVVQAAASLLGYGVTVYRHLPTDREYYILAEREDVKMKRYWGTYVFRIGEASGYLVQVPRPLFEVNSFEYGVTLFERLSARALLIGGTHPDANQNGSSDLISTANKENAFNLVNQVVLREESAPMLVIQSRAFGLKPDEPAPDASILLSFGNGAVQRNEVTVLGKSLLQILDEDRLVSRFVDGAKDVVGYEVGGLSQAQYLNETRNKEFMVLWLSPTARATYRQQQENRRLEAQFQALGVASYEKDLFSAITVMPRSSSATLPVQLRERVMRYLATQDVVIMHAVIRGWPAYRFKRVIDPNSRQAFLLISQSNGTLLAVANLAPRRPDRVLAVDAKSLQRSDVNGFVDSRMALLEFGKSK